MLRPGGVLQLLFKCGHGTITVEDRDYGAQRTFLLYDEEEVLGWLKALGMALVEAGPAGELGGLVYGTDPKGVRHCLLWCRKE